MPVSSPYPSDISALPHFGHTLPDSNRLPHLRQYCYECVTCCDDCDEYTLNSELTSVTNRYHRTEQVCPYCLREYYQLCDNCDEYYESDLISYVESEDMVVCDDCLETCFVVCDNCEKYFRDDSIIPTLKLWQNGTRMVCSAPILFLCLAQVLQMHSCSRMTAVCGTAHRIHWVLLMLPLMPAHRIISARLQYRL